jgi:glutamine amidotransferase-like uncharacterized protein
MGKLLSIVIASSCLLIAPAVQAATALVYNGPGACKENCAMAAGNLAAQAGLQVRFISNRWQSPEQFNDVVLWIQPGGDAVQVSKALSSAQREYIRNFVGRGGAYLGFCAGMFMADQWVDDKSQVPGFGILPVETDDYKDAPSPSILPIMWNGKIRQMYFEEGGYFMVTPGMPLHVPFHVIATYPTGKVAAIYTQFGQGRVGASGVHPEALESWKTGGQLADSDGPDTDLGIEMVKTLVPNIPVSPSSKK